jgi:hypothetical protein
LGLASKGSRFHAKPKPVSDSLARLGLGLGLGLGLSHSLQELNKMSN